MFLHTHLVKFLPQHARGAWTTPQTSRIRICEAVARTLKLNLLGFLNILNFGNPSLMLYAHIDVHISLFLWITVNSRAHGDSATPH